MQTRVLFICLGNTCRSPLAEFIGKRLYPHIAWESAGTEVNTDGEGRPMNENAAGALAGLEINVGGFGTRAATRDLLEEYDHLVFLDQAALRKSIGLTPGRAKLHCWDLPDPFGTADHLLYKATAKVIQSYIECFVSSFELERQGGPQTTQRSRNC